MKSDERPKEPVLMDRGAARAPCLVFDPYTKSWPDNGIASIAHQA